MTIELNPQQEQLLHLVMQQRHFRSTDEALDAALRSIALPVERQENASRQIHTPVEAAARLRELRKGTRLPEGMTIRAMIDEGRA